MNDYRCKVWELKGKDSFGFTQEVNIPNDKLRAGENVVVLQCYNKAHARGQSTPVVVTVARPAPAQPDLPQASSSA